MLRSCEKFILITLKSPFIFDSNGITQGEHLQFSQGLIKDYFFSYHKNILSIEIREFWDLYTGLTTYQLCFLRSVG